MLRHLPIGLQKGQRADDFFLTLWWAPGLKSGVFCTCNLRLDRSGWMHRIHLSVPCATVHCLWQGPATPWFIQGCSVCRTWYHGGDSGRGAGAGAEVGSGVCSLVALWANNCSNSFFGCALSFSFNLWSCFMNLSTNLALRCATSVFLQRGCLSQGQKMIFFNQWALLYSQKKHRQFQTPFGAALKAITYHGKTHKIQLKWLLQSPSFSLGRWGRREKGLWVL